MTAQSLFSLCWLEPVFFTFKWHGKRFSFSQGLNSNKYGQKVKYNLCTSAGIQLGTFIERTVPSSSFMGESGQSPLAVDINSSTWYVGTDARTMHMKWTKFRWRLWIPIYLVDYLPPAATAVLSLILAHLFSVVLVSCLLVVSWTTPIHRKLVTSGCPPGRGKLVFTIAILRWPENHRYSVRRELVRPLRTYCWSLAKKSSRAGYPSTDDACNSDEKVASGILTMQPGCRIRLLILRILLATS